MILCFDFARCLTGADCPRSETCLRWTDPGRPKYQTMAAFPSGADCYAYLPNTEAKVHVK